MLAEQTILAAAHRAAAAAESPLQVFLFGSYARGNADAGSDLDLLVVEREEFERRSQVPGTVPYWAKKEGKLLYDAAA